MPLPPPSPLGRASAAPFCRTEPRHAQYAWEESRNLCELTADDEALSEHAGGDTERSVRSSPRRQSAEDARARPVVSSSDDGDDGERERSRRGEAYITRKLPSKLKGVFTEAAKQREEFSTQKEHLSYLNRNERAVRDEVRDQAKQAAGRRLSQAALRAAEGRSREKEEIHSAKFEQRHGYRPGAFPRLPDFRMPKNATLERRLDRLDAACVKRLEADAKAGRRTKVKREKTNPKHHPSRVGLPGVEGNPEEPEGKGRTTAGDLLGAKTVQPRAEARRTTTMGRLAQKINPAIQATSKSARFHPEAPSSSQSDGSVTRDEAGAGQPVAQRLSSTFHHTLVYRQLQSIASQIDPTVVHQDGDKWMQMFAAEPRGRTNEQESLLPVLDERPLRKLAKEHMEWEKNSKDWRATMKDRIRNRIMDLHAQTKKKEEQHAGSGMDLEKDYKPWMAKSAAVKKTLCKSRLAMGERFSYMHLDKMSAQEKSDDSQLSIGQVHSARKLVSTSRMDLVLGKEDPSLDTTPRQLFRKHPFRWRELLEFQQHGEPAKPLDLWIMLQLLYVQFEPRSPRGRGKSSPAAKLEHLENEARRIEGLFAPTNLLANGVPQAERDALYFVSKTNKESANLEAKFARGALWGGRKDKHGESELHDSAEHRSSGTGSIDTENLRTQPPEIPSAGPESGPDQSQPIISPSSPSTRGLAAQSFYQRRCTALIGTETLPYEKSASEVQTSQDEEVSLSHYNLSIYQAAAAVIFLTQPTQRTRLRKLCLSNNNMDDTMFSMLLDGMDGTLQLEHLDVSSNRLQRTSGIVFAQHLERQHCVPLLELDFSRNPLGDKGAEALLEAFYHSKNSLLSLAMADVDATERIAGRLSELITAHNTLRHLDFSSNQLGARGGAGVGDALSTNGKLTSLKLSSCGFGDEGGRALMPGLLMAVSLRRVDLSSNKLGLLSVEALCSSLQGDPRPELSLLLRQNPLGRKACGLLMETVVSSSLADVDISQCTISESVELSNTNDSFQLADTMALGERAEDGLPDSSIFNPCSPSKEYSLDLSGASHRQVALVLLDRFARDGPSTWQHAKLNSRTITMSDALCQRWVGSATNWDSQHVPAGASSLEGAGLPKSGRLVVNFSTWNVSHRRELQPLKKEDLSNIWSMFDAPKASDDWLLDFLRSMPLAYSITSEQACGILKSFTWSRERVQAILALFVRLADPHTLDCALEQMLLPEERLELDQRLGIARRLDPRNLTGHYSLDLSLSIDLVIAARLLRWWVAESHLHACNSCNLQACWRNVVLNGAEVETVNLDPNNWILPVSGKIELDFVSYAAKLWHDTAGRSLAEEVALKQHMAARGLEVKRNPGVLSSAMLSLLVKELLLLQLKPLPDLVCMVATVDEAAVKRQHVKLADDFQAAASACSDMEAIVSEAKSRAAPKSEVKQLVAQLAGDREAYAGLQRSGLAQEMITAAVERFDSVGCEQIVSGEDATIPINEEPAESSEAPSATSAKRGKKPKSAKKGKNGKSVTAATSITNLQALLKVAEGNHEQAIRCVRSIVCDYWLLPSQVYLLTCLFNMAEHKRDVVIACYERIKHSSSGWGSPMEKLLRFLPVKAQVGVGEKLGWMNLLDATQPMRLKYKLNAMKRDDMQVLQYVVSGCVASAGQRGAEIHTDEDCVCGLSELHLGSCSFGTDIPHTELYPSLVSRVADIVNSTDSAQCQCTVEFRLQPCKAC